MQKGKKKLNPSGPIAGISCITSAKNQILTDFRDTPLPFRSLETTAGRSRDGSTLQKWCFSSLLEDGEGSHTGWFCLGKLSSLSCDSAMSQEPHQHLLGSTWPRPALGAGPQWPSESIHGELLERALLTLQAPGASETSPGEDGLHLGKQSTRSSCACPGKAWRKEE